MKKIARLGLLVGFALASTASSAQQPVCKRQGQIDQAATKALQDMLQRADPKLKQTLAGTWYFETRSPSTNQVSYMYFTFGPDTLFAYKNRVCGGLTGGCNDYEGIGLFAGIPTGNGVYTTMSTVSDLNRDSECSGGTLRVSGSTVRDGAGQVWRKVR